jgi:hypothetical protein
VGEGVARREDKLAGGRVTIPLFIWPALAIGCLLLLAWFDEREIKRQIDNFRDIEAERLAREASAPLGNASRVVE